jgi:DsbC/DsbD-like thiol-disulfide interchange protein/cytochrome c biogenesis protein CcdA
MKRLFALMLFMAAFSTGFTTYADAQMVDGKLLVNPSLVIGTNDFSKPFMVGVRFKIEKDWHLYWRNPGDAGIPPEVKWTLPSGFTISNFQFPTPHKLTDAGVVAYAYDTELILLCTVTPPNSGAPKSFTLKADLTWLTCRENCIPGSGSAELNTAKLSASDLAIGKAILSGAEQSLPASWTSQKLKLESASVTTVNGKPTVALKFSGEDANRLIDFFPEVIENFVVNYNEVKVQSGVITFPLQASNPTAKITSLKGILLLDKVGYEFTTLLTADVAPGGLLNQDFTVQGKPTDGLSLGLALLFAFIGGIILNFMPCVLPVISLKVMGFASQSGSSAAKSLTNGLFFAIGVLISFWVLALAAVLLQQAGQQVGWGFQFQSPAFVVAMTMVMFVFGLNLIGVFEFSAPNVSGGVGATLSEKGSLGSFMNGVLATTLATPCTAPFLGPALGFAFSQPAYVIFLIFTAVALGLSAPYLVLAAKPEWLKFIPKPGEWMNRFKQVMGFLLFATVVWLLSVIRAQLGADGIMATIALLLGMAVAFWVIGNYIDFNSTAARKTLVWSVALLMMLGSYYVTFERWLDWRATKPETAQKVEGTWQPFH